MRNRNEPYQRYVSSGYFKVIEQKVELPNGDIYINRKPVVFQKGLDFIRKLLLEAGYEYNKG
jgi:phage antirepressor YoqD-like protein